VKSVVCMQDRHSARCRPGVFDRALHAFRAGIGEKNSIQAAAHPRLELPRQYAGKLRSIHLHEAGLIQSEKIFQRFSNIRIVPANVENAISGQHVEIPVAVGIPQMRAPCFLVANIEPDDFQGLGELWIYMRRVQFIILCGAIR